MTTITFGPASRVLDAVPASVIELMQRSETILTLSYAPAAPGSKTVQLLALKQVTNATDKYLPPGLDVDTAMALDIYAILHTSPKIWHRATANTSNPQAISLEIMKAGNDIAIGTRRGVGNHVWCHPDTVAKFDTSWLPTMRIETFDQIHPDQIIVSYTGKSTSLSDAGLFLCPFRGGNTGQLYSCDILFQSNWEEYYRIIDL